MTQEEKIYTEHALSVAVVHEMDDGDGCYQRCIRCSAKHSMGSGKWPKVVAQSGNCWFVPTGDRAYSRCDEKVN